ncbi:MAG: SpoIIE family protein phosphatase [Bacteroidia bacterium]
MRKIVFLLLSFILAYSLVSTSVYGQSKPLSVDALIESTQNDSARVQVLINLSLEYLNSDPQKGFDYAINALVLATHLNNKRLIALSNNNLGDFYWYKYDFVSSEACYKEGLKIFEELNDSSSIANSYRNIAWIYQNKNQDSASLECNKKALKINLKRNKRRAVAANYSDLGINYTKLKTYDSAMIYHCKALEIEEKSEQKKQLPAIYDNISNIYSELGANWLAIDMSLTALKYSEEFGNKRYMMGACNLLSELNKKVKDYDGSIHFAKLSIQSAREINDKNAINNLYKSLAETYALMQDYTQALHYTQLSNVLSDSLFNEKNGRLHEEMKSKYESENKLLLIQNLKKDKLITEQKLEQEKKTKLYFSTFAVLVGVFALIMFRNNKQQEKINTQLAIASDDLRHKNQEIIDSILYSKRIQDVSLPTDDLRGKLFPNSFIIYHPKEVVSGDFYWYAEKNGKRIIACCDCTGHGVPGALMSMIGINSLNKIVNAKGITQPNLILELFHKEISKTLLQDETTIITDTIDVSVVCFNTETEIEYAGANSCLFIAKNTKTNTKLLEIQPDLLSIGVIKATETITYTNHKIQLQQNDCIYMFSDGLLHQPSLISGEKYGIERLKQLLTEVASYPIIEQKATIQNNLISWIGAVEQIDDISVIGIKI